MKKCLPFLFICILLTGCAALLERSYSVVEPYSDRYWDSAAEDTLRVENHQDLVNSLLMLVDERAEEGVIRCYGAANSYMQVRSACKEVSEETALGSYLLDSLTFSYETASGYCSITCRMAYREDTEDPENLMSLSDSQSLVDLLRLAVREDHEKLTARFSYQTPREEVAAAVESLWQELCTDGTAAPEPSPPDTPESAEADSQEVPDEPPPEEAETAGTEMPSCPWEIRFYPDDATPEIVEILLAEKTEKQQTDQSP